MAAQCANEREVGSALNAFAAKYPHAHHLAYAYRVKNGQGPVSNIVQRFSDAGEPSGTAGMPILKLLEGRNLINVAVGVIRYYGGVNLGAGGLARAYGGTAKLALDLAKMQDFVEIQTIELTIEYKQMDLLSKFLVKCNGNIVRKKFDNEINIVVNLPVKEVPEFLSRFSPRAA